MVPKAIVNAESVTPVTMEEVAYRLTAALLKVVSNRGAPGLASEIAVVVLPLRLTVGLTPVIGAGVINVVGRGVGPALGISGSIGIAVTPTYLASICRCRACTSLASISRQKVAYLASLCVSHLASSRRSGSTIW
jgi:hypothetical protein